MSYINHYTILFHCIYKQVYLINPLIWFTNNIKGALWHRIKWHRVKSVLTRCFIGPYFSAFGLNTEVLSLISVFSPNAGKYRPEKLRIWTLFTSSAKVFQKIFMRFEKKYDQLKKLSFNSSFSFRFHILN